VFSKFYQSELTYLREMGRAFSLEHPNLAPLLAERSADPDVERLLEGFAFVTARIRERLEDAVPELSHELTQLVLPHYLRPVPSCSMVEFTAAMRSLRGPVKIARGTELVSTPVEGTACSFRTTEDVELLPLTVSRVETVRTSSTAVDLKLLFETTEGGRASVLGSPLKLYLHGELANASSLFMSLMQHCTGVSLRDKAGREKLRLRRDALVAPAFRETSMLFPWPPLVPTGYARLQEYFTLPQKFLFVEVRGLEAAAPLTEDSFELVFLLDAPPTLSGTLSPENFRLSCTPVVNLFSTSTDPLRQTSTGQEHFLRAHGMTPQHAEIFSVDQVVGIREGERSVYQPFSLFPHLSRRQAQPFFQLRRAHSVLDAGADATLVIGSPLEVQPHLGDEVLSVDVTCTNRVLAGRLGLGEINRGREALPGGSRVKNISTVTQPVPAPLGSELHWRLLSHLAVTQRTLADDQALRGLLELYNLQVLGDVGQARANSARIEAIRRVQATPARRLYKGSSVQGTRLLLDVEERNFASLGDLYLFGCVLDALFASFVTMNSFSELNFKTQPSQFEFVWPIRIGTKLPQ
jgi:type VI secretion system protein ImpG